MNKYWFILFFVVPFSIANAQPHLINNIRLSPSDKKFRMVFDMTSPIENNIFILTHPDRLVVDLKNTKLNTDLSQLSFVKTPIRHVRSSLSAQKDLRIVFDLIQPFRVNNFLLKKTKTTPDRLVLDFISPTDVFTQQAVSLAKPKVTKPLVTQRDVIVMIDAGHGGTDPGAIGPRGTREKDIVLGISKKLFQLINQQPGMRAVMTRNSDDFIGLRERLHRTRKAEADIFIAIHADAFSNSRSRGASVFALSERGASSEAARWLAEKENYSELGGIKLDDTSELLRSVLIDLAQTATISDSLQVGSMILNRLGKFAKLHRRKVEQARFVVLKSPDIPSILVETGFLSNPHEEQMLRKAHYQLKVAQAIMEGTRAYFDLKAPQGSYFFAKKQGINISKGRRS